MAINFIHYDFLCLSVHVICKGSFIICDSKICGYMVNIDIVYSIIFVYYRILLDCQPEFLKYFKEIKEDSPNYIRYE
ncbi:MAG: hypothetical protein B6230_02225 [Desulfobacteraceae bacterium 4572_89]|nr:MAG: hypothetical protein B6230_02225 [Desulfobacteraceae bacterium 4572_89]